MGSWATTRGLFLLGATSVLAIHFTLMYLFIREQLLAESRQTNFVASLDYRDERSPLEADSDPNWGLDAPNRFYHDTNVRGRHLEEFSNESLKGKETDANKAEKKWLPMSESEYQHKAVGSNNVDHLERLVNSPSPLGEVMVYGPMRNAAEEGYSQNEKVAPQQGHISRKMGVIEEESQRWNNRTVQNKTPNPLEVNDRRARSRSLQKGSDKQTSEDKGMTSFLPQQQEMRTCPTIIQPEEDFEEPLEWQEVLPGQVFVFSAYLDKDVHGRGVIVVVGMGEVTRLLPDSRAYHCQVWYRSGGKGAKSVPAKLINIPEHQNVSFVSVLFHCPSQLEEDPFAVAIVMGHNCDEESTNLLSIRNIDESQARTRAVNNFTVCTKPAYSGFGDVKALVEMAELNFLFGADRIVLYDHGFSEQVKKTYDSYKNQELATVIPWDLPVQASSHTQNVDFYLASLAALNDCLYRFKFSSRYVIFTDMNEFIVPRQVTTWSELVAKLQPLQDASALRFSDVFFPLDLPDDEHLKAAFHRRQYHLHTQLKVRRLQQTQHHPRHMVVPADVDMVGARNTVVLRRGRLLEVSPQDAAVHRYRYRTSKDGTTYSTDRTAQRYGAALLRRVRKRHNLVQGL